MKKKSVKRRLKLDRIFILVLVVALIGYLGTNYYDELKIKKINIKEQILEPKEKKYELSLVMVGDNLIHAPLYNEAHRNANYNGYDFKPIYSYLKEKVKDYDLAYYNQETILGGSEIGLSSYPAFNSPYELGNDMIDAGFNLVSLATNHTLDRGEVAINNSNNYWKSKDNVLTSGSYTSFEDREEVRIKEKNHITYTMLNYTYGTNGIPVPYGKEYLVNVWPMDLNANYGVGYEAYKEQVKKDIEKVRDKVDVLMVAMHWGVEYELYPSNYQKDAAQFLADLGVDIIIGSHPHVVQPVTWIDDTLVIYSLGNLVSSQEKDYDYAKLVGLMSSVKITKTVKGPETKITLSNLNNELLYTYYSSDYTKNRIIPFTSSDIASYNSDYQRLYNKYSAVIKGIDNTIPVASIS